MSNYGVVSTTHHSKTFIELMAAQRRPHAVGYDMPAKRLDTAADVLENSRAVHARLRPTQAPVVRRADLEPEPEPAANPDIIMPEPHVPGPPRRRRLPREYLFVRTKITSQGGTWRHAQCEEILQQVSIDTGISVAEMRGYGRTRAVVDARFEAFHRIATELGYSSTMIGHVMGGRDHSTVIHGIAKRKERLEAATAA